MNIEHRTWPVVSLNDCWSHALLTRCVLIGGGGGGRPNGQVVQAHAPDQVHRQVDTDRVAVMARRRRRWWWWWSAALAVLGGGHCSIQPVACQRCIQTVLILMANTSERGLATRRKDILRWRWLVFNHPSGSKLIIGPRIGSERMYTLVARHIHTALTKCTGFGLCKVCVWMPVVNSLSVFACTTRPE